MIKSGSIMGDLEAFTNRIQLLADTRGYPLSEFEKMPKDWADEIIRTLFSRNYGTEDGMFVKKPIDIEQFFDNYGKSREKFIPERLGNFIKSKYVFKTPKDTQEIFVYKEGIYEPTGETLIQNEVRRILGEKAKEHEVYETVSQIKQTTYINREDINNNKFKVVFKNGILNLETLEMETFSSDYFFTFKIPVEYDKDAKCDLFLTWLHDVLKGDGEEWKTKVIQEWFGYHFLKDNRYERALLLQGKPDSRKSTLLKILENFVGNDNVSNTPLQFFNENPFAVAYVVDKVANICADLTNESLRNTEKFMVLVGNDSLTVAKKGQHDFKAKSMTKFSFSCNDIPRLPDKSKAFYKRWLVVKFLNPISKNEVKEEYNESSISPLMTSEMLKGILNWAIEGLKRLLVNHKFSYPYSYEETKLMWEKGSDSTSVFYEICVEDSDFTDSIIKRDVYKKYKEFCDEEGLKVENQVKFGRYFIALSGCGTGKKDSLPCYTGIRFKRGEIQSNLGQIS